MEAMRGVPIRLVAVFALVSLLAGCSASTVTPPETEPPKEPPEPDITYVPGQSYFGVNGYVEYIAGNLPTRAAVPPVPGRPAAL